LVTFREKMGIGAAAAAAAAAAAHVRISENLFHLRDDLPISFDKRNQVSYVFNLIKIFEGYP
jgi:hypothetical protein